MTFVAPPAPAPDLTIAKRHSGTFTQGQTGAQYTIAVSNGGTAPTSGMVQVVDTLPTGLSATTLSGAGWNCTLGTLTCTRSDALAPGSSYADVTLTVDVAGNAPASLTNSASVVGGGEPPPTTPLTTRPVLRPVVVALAARSWWPTRAAPASSRCWSAGRWAKTRSSSNRPAVRARCG